MNCMSQPPWPTIRMKTSLWPLPSSINLLAQKSYTNKKIKKIKRNFLTSGFWMGHLCSHWKIISSFFWHRQLTLLLEEQNLQLALQPSLHFPEDWQHFDPELYHSSIFERKKKCKCCNYFAVEERINFTLSLILASVNTNGNGLTSNNLSLSISSSSAIRFWEIKLAVCQALWRSLAQTLKLQWN